MKSLKRTQLQLDIARDNDLGCYGTPSSDGSLGGYYWASNPSWANDVCVAICHDFDTWSYGADDEDCEHSCQVAESLEEISEYA